MSCNRSCSFGGTCDCERSTPPHIHAVDTLVDGKLTRSIITPEWRERMLSEPDAEPAAVMARWPGGIGGLPDC